MARKSANHNTPAKQSKNPKPGLLRKETSKSEKSEGGPPSTSKKNLAQLVRKRAKKLEEKSQPTTEKKSGSGEAGRHQTRRKKESNLNRALEQKINKNLTRGDKI